MNDLVLETIRVLVLAGACLFLWRQGQKRRDLSRRGWNWIRGGFGLLLLASLLDVSDNFSQLDRWVVIGAGNRHQYPPAVQLPENSSDSRTEPAFFTFGQRSFPESVINIPYQAFDVFCHSQALPSDREDPRPQLALCAMFSFSANRPMAHPSLRAVWSDVFNTLR